jgi:hypothetical protein
MKLDVKLEKSIYRAGEKVIGKIEFEQPMINKVKGLKVVAKGEEKTEIVESHEVPVPVTPIPPVPPVPPTDPTGSGMTDEKPTGSGMTDEKPTPTTTRTETETLQESDTFFMKDVELSSSTSPVSFDLELPSDARNSYQGKYAWITYEVQAIADRWGPFDPAKEVGFNVVNPGQAQTSGTKVSFNKEADGMQVTIELQKDAFSSGETITGNITIKNPGRKEIKTAEIILKGIEVANAQNASRTTNLEEYKKNINWNEGGTASFDMQIPKESRKSYSGKYFRYYWEFEVHINLGFWSQDIHVNRVITIT